MTTKTRKKKHPAIGSSLEALLREEGLYEECHARAVKEFLQDEEH